MRSFSPFWKNTLDDNLNILIEESRSHIAQMMGRAAELTACAEREQKLVDALCMAQNQIENYKRKYEAGNISLCAYIQIEGILNTGIWQPEQFEQKLREACEQDSKTLATFLRENEKKGYLHFHGDSKTKVFETLRNHFPSMRKYGYNTFATYF